MAPSPEALKIRTQQGVGSTTFTRPPFYGPLTIPDLYAFHAEHSPDHPVIVYENEHGQAEELCHKHVFRGIKKAAKIVLDHVQNSSVSPPPNAAPNVVVGILAVLDFPTYFTTLLGTMYSGHTPFPISARNSAPAVAQLLSKTSASLLMVSADSAMQRLAHETKELLAKEGFDVQLLPLPTFRDLYNEDPAPEVQRVPVTGDSLALILHSSGSTSFPKPITMPHRNYTKWAFMTYFGGVDLCGVRMSMHCLPLFHMMGVLTLVYPAGSGAVMVGFRPVSPPIAPTPDSILKSVVAVQAKGMICVPAFIEAWARSESDLAALKTLKFIVYAGASLSRQVGDMLNASGINVFTAFGATEFGALARHINGPKSEGVSDWEYFTFSDPVEYVKRYQEGQPGVFEPVVLESPTWSPNVFNCEVDGRRAYATSDLFVEHPEDPNLFKVFGRVDDQITLSTGEKTNPVPMEATLLTNANIKAAIVFGRGRLQNGVIIQPAEPFDPNDEAKLEAFRNSIWATVEHANSFAPSHSRIFKEMIAVTSPNKPFQFTAKGTPRRHVCLADYKEEIDELYKKVEESSQVDVAPPAVWTDVSTRAYVRGVVERVMAVPNIADDDDLFSQGCDSLQATWIRNTILHALRTTTKVSVHDIPLLFVYSYPTINALSAFLHDFLAGKSAAATDGTEARVAKMHALRDKYSAAFPAAQWKSADATATTISGAGAVVLLTGSTGGLGSTVLAELLQRPDVARVYALNRAAGGDAAALRARQLKAFETWGLDGALLEAGKVQFVPADLTKPDLGLDGETVAELRRSVTAILHSAWRVDFNVTLQSFEPLLAGTRNLVDFALSSSVPGGPALVFVSSISSVQNYSSSDIVPETLDIGADAALSQGYGESKWVAEQILGRAARETGLRATAARVGQLSGHSRSGAWNTKEWVPALVRASTRARLGCVPARDDTVSWVPIDVAASTLLDFLLGAGAGAEPVLHLSAPRATAWNDIFAPLAARLGVPLVSAPEWLAKLRAAAAAAKADAHEGAYTLLAFYEGALAGPGRGVRLGTERGVRASASLAALDGRPLGGEDASRWVGYWERVGFVEV